MPDLLRKPGRPAQLVVTDNEGVLRILNEHLSTPAQLLVCERFGVKPYAATADLKVGVARNVKDAVWPLNGLRHPPEGDTTGWYIWAGEELSSAPDFFEPLHVGHLADWCPIVLPYLALPPGWRFLLAPGNEDVWEDPELLTP